MYKKEEEELYRQSTTLFRPKLQSQQVYEIGNDSASKCIANEIISFIILLSLQKPTVFHVKRIVYFANNAITQVADS